MPTINIKGQDFPFVESDVINFSEGLVGLPELRRAVLVPLADCEPFCWLASPDDEKTRFIVVNPNEIFEDYKPFAFAGDESRDATLVIVKVCSDWRRTTVNLRAPIFVDSASRDARQVVLTDSDYRLSEELPTSDDE